MAHQSGTWREALWNTKCEFPLVGMEDGCVNGWQHFVKGCITSSFDVTESRNNAVLQLNWVKNGLVLKLK